MDTAVTSEGTVEKYNALVGTTSNFSFKTKTFNWRILKLDEKNDNLTIIADGLAGNIGLSGAMGYNNGVLLLNTIMEKLYSYKKFGAIGRSVSIADCDWFNEQYVDPPAGTTWGTTTNLFYPKIYSRDWYGNVDGKVNIEIGGSTTGKPYFMPYEQDYFYSSTKVSGTPYRGLGEATEELTPSKLCPESFVFTTPSTVRFAGNFDG